jgi:hypothetical protein
MLNITSAKSAISRTNQIRIEESPEVMSEHFFQYLYKKGRGIEHFILDPAWRSDTKETDGGQYNDRHQIIKDQVKQRLAAYKDWDDTAEPQYFVAYSNEQTHVYFLSPNNGHSGWKDLFCSSEPGHRQRILNLIFKFYILSQRMNSDAISGFEEVILPHTKRLGEKNDNLYVWGLKVNITFNNHKVLTMHLQKKFQTFSPGSVHTLDGGDLGEIQIYNKKKYYFNYKNDARKKNPIVFMHFENDDEGYEKFKKTQLYYYQMLMSQLETFLTECGIKFSQQDFQANGYLDHSFINDEHLEKAESLDSLVIINNTGADLKEKDQQFLNSFFQHQGVLTITHYQQGKTISKYQQVNAEKDEDAGWQISEVFPWEEIKPEQEHNYLVFNRELDEESGSIAYQGSDGFWYSSTDLKDDSKLDFYSQFKRRFSYLATGKFYSMQGINVKSIIPIREDTKKTTKENTAILTYSKKKVDAGDIRLDCSAYTNDQYLSIEDSIVLYSVNQTNKQSWEKFCDKYLIKPSPEFQRVLIEISIKSWMRAALSNPTIGLPINNLAFSEMRFYTVYVRSPKIGQAQAVAVDFLYKDGMIYLKGVTRDMGIIEEKFKFLRRRKTKSAEKLIDDQQIYVDENSHDRISTYTDDYYTPTLIGRRGILEEMARGTLAIGRKTMEEDSSRLLPLATYYSGESKHMNEIQNMICLDTEKPTYIQYYVPPKTGLKSSVKNGFRVYHLIGYRNGEQMTTQELVENPLVALHFNTITQNILKISENSQSSLLQKVAKVLIEN